ncbi:MAG: cryptochrome/photolyase family protein, partial [Henriciella sp.]
MTKALLIFPHQLFRPHPGIAKHPDRICLIEDKLFFGDAQYPMQFHKQKLWLHRASMARYAKYLDTLKTPHEYVSYDRNNPVLEPLIARLAKDGVTEIEACDPVDLILEKRRKYDCEAVGVELRLLNTPL